MNSILLIIKSSSAILDKMYVNFTNDFSKISCNFKIQTTCN